MKKSRNVVAIRSAIAIALSVTLINLVPRGGSSAEAASRSADLNLRSESQIRGEAARYDSAVAEIGTISTMKLETADDLSKAIAILDRNRPSLKFQLSKLAFIGLSDSGFSSAVRTKAPDKGAAEAFAKELAADSSAILKLNGAQSLKSRMSSSAQTDAATLRKAGERLKEAAEKIRKASEGRRAQAEGSAGLRVIRAGFSVSRRTEPEPAAYDGTTVLIVVIVAVAFVLNPGLTIALAALAATVAAAATPTAVAAILVAGAVAMVANLVENLGTQEGRDAVSRCQDDADARLRRCLAATTALPGIIQLPAQAACEGQWALDAGFCLVS